MIDNLPLQSPNMVNENIDKIAALFPNCISETANGKAIDFDLLKQELSPDIIDGLKERYRLEWPGKRESIVTANIPTTKTLRPIIKDSVNFDTTQNLYIEGDNLEVLKILQESYLGKVKMIYIDPPYNTGKDFVYKDNFAIDAEQYKSENEKDEYGQRLFVNPDSSGRYHSDWLSMIYPRLKLARNLLTDDGVIFISIDDNEVYNLRKVCDEVFGESNFIAMISNINNPKGRSDDKFIATAHEYVVVYSKDIGFTKVYGFELEENIIKRYNKADSNNKIYREIDLRKTGDSDKRMDRPDMFYYFYFDQKITGRLEVSKVKLDDKDKIEIIPLKDDNTEGRWRWGFQTALDNLNKVFPKFMPSRKIWGIFEMDYLEGRPAVKSTSVWAFKDVNSERGTEQIIELGFTKETFSRPKPIGTLRRTIDVGTHFSENSIILDFFSGSATTAHAVMQSNATDGGNRKFIMVQVPESTDEKSEAYKEGYKNICEIGKERIRRAGKKILEEQSAENDKKAAEIGFEKEEKNMVDIGFRVYRLDSSNMQDVYYKPKDFKQENLDLFASNIKPDRSPEDLLAQVMLSWGLPLHYKIESLSIQNKQVFKIEENSLFACFDNGIDETFAKEIATHLPLRIVFKDDSFKDDTAKENVKQLLKQLSPNTEMKVI